MEKHVLLVSLHKNGMEQNVLIDVITEKYGTLLLKAAFAHQDNSGTDMPASSVLMVKLGALILKVANVQFHLPGMELLALFVQEVEYIIM
jgi:hypothetical protein